MVSITHEQHTCNIIITHFDSTAHEQTIICRHLFASHMVGSQPMKTNEKMPQMKMTINPQVHVGYEMIQLANKTHSLSWL